MLRAGGNAVDAAVAAMLASWACEPLLTGPGAGGYMLVAAPGGDPVLLDFFVEAPGRGSGGGPPAQPLLPVEVSFTDAIQIFHVGAASIGTYGTPSGIEAAARRFGTLPLADLAAPAAALARAGVPLNRQQAYVFRILAPIMLTTPAASELLMRDDVPPVEGDVLRFPELAETIERLGREGAVPFYEGDIAAAVCDTVAAHGGGRLCQADLRAYETVERAPVAVDFRGVEMLTNPPPSAGGILIAYALAMLARLPAPVGVLDVVAAMTAAHEARSDDFAAHLADPGFADTFLASRLGSTTHISVLDADGMACSVTCTNGEGSGVIVPGTGIHLNNMMGEEDLSPAGFFTHPPGRRLPSMMAPTVVRRDGEVELVLGSAGSNRIRSAILQVVLGVFERGLDIVTAIEAPRVHLEEGIVYAEPGIDAAALRARRPPGHALPRAQPVLRRRPGGPPRPRDRRSERRRRPAPRRRGGGRVSGGGSRTLDVRGLACPLPLLRARAALATEPLAAGETLVVLADDPEAPIDLAALAADQGLGYEEQPIDGGAWRIVLVGIG